MKTYETTNYGRLGGTLDATKHVRRAAEKMLTESELEKHGFLPLDQAARMIKCNCCQN